MNRSTLIKDSARILNSIDMCDKSGKCLVEVMDYYVDGSVLYLTQDLPVRCGLEPTIKVFRGRTSSYCMCRVPVKDNLPRDDFSLMSKQSYFEASYLQFPSKLR